jgi:hypothetical protein
LLNAGWSTFHLKWRRREALNLFLLFVKKPLTSYGQQFFMATRYGYLTLLWLLQRGWEEAYLFLEEDVIGDQHVRDSITGKVFTVYDAAKVQQERKGEYPEFLMGR